mmetsp:Transcript_94203/g.294754  ORF Transcript_94203/g.294754 Transcript_94203/m.294754 type:complete len:287 (+) Transcript_94203:3-863(+)
MQRTHAVRCSRRLPCSPARLRPSAGPLQVQLPGHSLHGLHGPDRGHLEAQPRELLHLPRLDLVELRGGEEDEAEPLALEGLHAVRAVAVEEHKLLGQVQHYRLLGIQLGHVATAALLDVLREVVQLASRELPQGLDCGGALVVGIAVPSASVVVVDIDAREPEVGRNLLPLARLEPPTEELGDVLVARRGVEDAVRPVPDPESPQRVAVYGLHALRQDVEPRLVVGEAPGLQYLGHVAVGDGLAGLQLPPGHLVRNDSGRLDVRTLRVALLARLLVYLVEVHAIVL